MPDYRSELNPVFIVGTPRSGTTLLYRTLLKHPSFKPKDLCLEETKIFLKPDISIISQQKPDSLFNYMLEDEEAYLKYLKSIRAERIWQEIFVKSGVIRFILDKPVSWNLLLNPRIVRKYFYFARQARGCQRIIEKTPRHLHRYNRISKSFPSSKIIITIRHPVDVYSSYKKRMQRDPDSNWLDYSLPEFVKRYRDMSVHVYKLNKFEKVLCIKYENFVENPEQEFRRICRHIDEPFLKEPLIEGEKRLSEYQVDPYLSKPIMNKTKNWSDYLREDQVILLERKLQPEMNQFGYPSRLKE